MRPTTYLPQSSLGTRTTCPLVLSAPSSRGSYGGAPCGSTRATGVTTDGKDNPTAALRCAQARPLARAQKQDAPRSGAPKIPGAQAADDGRQLDFLVRGRTGNYVACRRPTDQRQLNPAQ